MDFADLLVKHGIELATTLVMRHRPVEAELRKVLPWLAAERPATFNAYQSAYKPLTEKKVTKSKHIASFIGHAPAKAVFVGVYKIAGWEPKTCQQYWKISENVDLRTLGMRDWDEDDLNQVLWFRHQLTNVHADWKGKLVINWPPPDRAWVRRGEKNAFTVHAILEESILVAGMPEWDDLVLTWQQLETIPQTWRAKLEEWRGIYFILDTTDGKGYIGSAYGNDNIFGRWKYYAATGHGGNKQLRRRKRENFRFSILELVSPGMDSERVLKLEASWKRRLHTRMFGLNEN